ncbi:unnamed protein product, partial [Toxocara canis]|uniref:WD_REPEATS_REGION domain-containing protein n=1 Tax=Toxocara canis TaxID=6265 RepID=A0A183V9V4_TOXCA
MRSTFTVYRLFIFLLSYVNSLPGYVAYVLNGRGVLIACRNSSAISCLVMVLDSRSVHMQSDIELPDVPDSYFGNFCSRELLTSITVPFVCCRFSPEISSEGLLALGNEAGVLFIANVEHASSEENLFKRAMFVDVGCVLDVEFIFGRPSYLVAISGHSNVTLWDVDRGISVLRFVAHEGSVRALAVSSDSPDVFATGARDGTIYIWDQREKPKRGMTVEPVSMISSAHLFRPGRTTSLSASKKRTPSRAKEGPKGITSLAFLDANTLISASTSCQTGILFRDLRYWGSNIPVRTLEYPCSTAKRDFGVTSVCLDRWRSTLFASTTDSFIWEYAINSTKNIPVDVLRGVKRSSVGAFDMKLAASPISDHLTFGSGDRYALLWDLQEKRYFNNHPSSRRDKYYPYPKFVLGGHASEVSLAQFSCSARYIVSMDETTWRLWQFNGSRTEKEIGARPSGFEQVEYYSFQPSQGTSSQLERLSLTPTIPLSSKRKTPMASPFKSPFKSGSVARSIDGERSPDKKISKMSSSPLSPLPNICNVKPAKHSKFIRSARRLSFSPENVFTFENENDNVEVARRPKCAYHFKLGNISNFVLLYRSCHADEEL